MIKKHTNTETDIFESKNIDQLQRYCATAAVHGRRGARTTSDNFGFPAVGNGVGALVRPSLTSMVGTRLRSWCSASLRIRPHGQQLSDWGIESVAGRRDIRPVASPPSTCGNPWSLDDISAAWGYFRGKDFEEIQIFRPAIAETMISERWQSSQELSTRGL